MDVFLLILLLYGCGMALSFHRAIYEYHIIHLEKTWFDARQYCRQHYTDLATFRDTDDISSFKRPGWFTDVVWIGLFDDPASWKQVMGNEANSWRWSVTGTTSPGGYQNWWSTEPDFAGAQQHQCGVLNNGVWGDFYCSSLLSFVCFTGSVGGPKQYTYISTGMSWEDARSHCRQHHTDLAMIEDESENTAAASVLAPNQWTWFGLYRQPWRWSDGSGSQFKNWGSGSPNNLGKAQHCVWEDNSRTWNDRTCSEKKKFVCQRALQNQKHHFTLKFQSDVDLSDPAYSSLMTQKLVAALLNKGLTDLIAKWKAPPQKIENKRKSLNFEC